MDLDLSAKTKIVIYTMNIQIFWLSSFLTKPGAQWTRGRCLTASNGSTKEKIKERTSSGWSRMLVGSGVLDGVEDPGSSGRDETRDDNCGISKIWAWKCCPKIADTTINYRCDDGRFWLSAFDCQVPTLSPNFSKPSRTANSDLGIMQSKIYQFLHVRAHASGAD